MVQRSRNTLSTFWKERTVSADIHDPLSLSSSWMTLGYKQSTKTTFFFLVHSRIQYQMWKLDSSDITLNELYSLLHINRITVMVFWGLLPLHGIISTSLCTSIIAVNESRPCPSRGWHENSWGLFSRKLFQGSRKQIL